jgi:amino-acid N-acetyltransferase
MQIRKARAGDGIRIHKLINDFARQEVMLPRTLLSVYENIRDFYVAVIDGQVVGCSALHFTWGDMAEVRSLAVDPAAGGKGVGRALVEANITEAREHGLIQVYAFTYVTGFFEKLGFRVAQHETLPRKVWMDCVNCHKFNCCDEVAVVLDLVEGTQPEPFDPTQVSRPQQRVQITPLEAQ